MFTLELWGPELLELYGFQDMEVQDLELVDLILD